jgi:glycosyltransferase involved in cell wall biosynthesis
MDPRIRYLRHDVNRGAAWNHNVLISEARGRYFRWHHCDDRCEPRHLELCIAALESDPTAVLAYPRTVLIDAAGKVTANYADRLALCEESACGRLRHLLRNVFLCNPVLGVIRMDALRRTALLGSYIRSDHVLLAELAMGGRWIEVPEMLFRRRIHAGKSTEANRSVRDRAAWFDPKLRAKMIIWPNMQLFLEHLKAVWRAKIGLRQSVLCTWTVVAWQSGVETHRLRERFRRLRAGVAARMGLEFGTGKPASKRNGTY